MRLAFAAALAMLLAFAQGATAQTKQPPDTCTQRIDRVADRIPDLSENPNAARELGLDEKQLQGALAALDAARLANDPARCDVMVDAAETILKQGSR